MLQFRLVLGPKVTLLPHSTAMVSQSFAPAPPVQNPASCICGRLKSLKSASLAGKAAAAGALNREDLTLVLLCLAPSVAPTPQSHLFTLECGCQLVHLGPLALRDLCALHHCVVSIACCTRVLWVGLRWCRLLHATLLSLSEQR